MKKLQLLLLLIFFNLGFAQVEADNRFSKSETETTTTGKYNQEADDAINNDDVLQRGPGNVGDPVPINQYVGFLLVTAVGFILYTTQKKRKFLSKNNNL